MQVCLVVVVDVDDKEVELYEKEVLLLQGSSLLLSPLTQPCFFLLHIRQLKKVVGSCYPSCNKRP